MEMQKTLVSQVGDGEQKRTVNLDKQHSARSCGDVVRLSVCRMEHALQEKQPCVCR